jgi:hypothetical protein
MRRILQFCCSVGPLPTSICYTSRGIGFRNKLPGTIASDNIGFASRDAVSSNYYVYYYLLDHQALYYILLVACLSPTVLVESS